MSLRPLFARAAAWTAGTAPPSVRAGVAVNNIEVYHAVDALTRLANAGAMGAAVGACASGHHRVSG